MRAKLYTPDGTLGFVDLVDGADVADVVRAMREHRLFITPAEQAEPPPAAATTLPVAPGGGPELTLPGDRAIGGAPRRRRPA